MNTLSEADILLIFKALSNDARLQILKWLKDPEYYFEPQGEIGLVENGVCVSQITKKLNMTQSTASQYLSNLQKVGLLDAKRIGKWTYYKRNELLIQEIAKFIVDDL